MIKSSTAVTSQSHSGQTEPQVVRPLTRRGYERLPGVDRQIADAASLDTFVLVKRAQQRDPSAPEFLSPETLVYFIRRAIRNEDLRIRDELFRELLERCNPHFRGKFRGFGREDREDLQGEVQRMLIEDLFAENARGDFMEVRFWAYLERKCIDAIRKASRHTEDVESLETGRSGTGDSDGRAKLEQAVDRRLSPEELAMISKGLELLPPHLRHVFLLRHYFGMKIGPDNLSESHRSELTIAGEVGRTGRTIRNWLKEADRLLAGFREAHDGK